MGKSDAINIMKNSDLNEKSKLLYFFVIQKIDNKTTYYQKNKEKILNRTKEYYENNKKRLTEQTRNKYRELSNKKRDKNKREYGRNRYQNMSGDNKQRLKYYHKNYRKAKTISIKFSFKFFFT